MTDLDTTTPAATVASRAARGWAWVRENRWFTGVFLLGALLRVLAIIGYQPALWFPDTYTYVVTAIRPRPDLVRPAGYSFFLRLFEPFRSFGLVVFVQHLMGLAVAVLVYGAIRRKVLGVVAAAVVLLDAYQIQLEHLLVSDTLFLFLVVAATVLALKPPTWRRALGIGLLLAAATVTRTVGLPLILVFLVLYGWRARQLAGVFAVGALVPVVAYGVWFHAAHDRVGLVGANGAFLYVRVMPFAECQVMEPPADLAVLCDDRDPRPPAQDYVWDDASPLVRLPGETFTPTNDALAQRFAVLAITRQPGDYLAAVARDLVRAFETGPSRSTPTPRCTTPTSSPRPSRPSRGPRTPSGSNSPVAMKTAPYPRKSSNLWRAGSVTIRVCWHYRGRCSCSFCSVRSSRCAVRTSSFRGRSHGRSWWSRPPRRSSTTGTFCPPPPGVPGRRAGPLTCVVSEMQVKLSTTAYREMSTNEYAVRQPKSEIAGPGDRIVT